MEDVFIDVASEEDVAATTTAGTSSKEPAV
jgi:hypothetical protein